MCMADGCPAVNQDLKGFYLLWLTADEVVWFLSRLLFFFFFSPVLRLQDFSSFSCLPDSLTKTKGAILKMSICVFLAINLFFFFFSFYDSRWEHLHTVSAVMQTVCVSLISRHIRCIVKNQNVGPLSFILSGFNAVQRRCEYFSFLSLISYS